MVREQTACEFAVFFPRFLPLPPLFSHLSAEEKVMVELSLIWKRHRDFRFFKKKDKVLQKKFQLQKKFYFLSKKCFGQKQLSPAVTHVYLNIFFPIARHF